MTQKDKPLVVLDAHAGIGRYDLQALESQRTGEWKEGIAKLMVAARDDEIETLLKPYLDVISDLNPDQKLRYYPGSPETTVRMLRKIDRAILNELHPVDADILRANFIASSNVRLTRVDASQSVKAELPFPEKRGLLLIDPAFEVKDEAEKVLRMVAQALKRMANLVVLVWYPIKTPQFASEFHAAIKEATKRPALAFDLMVKEPFAEGGLAGSGVLVINPPHVLEAEMNLLIPCLQKAMATPKWGRGHVSWINPAL